MYATQQMIQTLVVSSRDEQADRLAEVLRTGRDIAYLGRAHRADDALQAINELRPDAVLIDDPVYGATTPGLVQELLKLHSSTVIIVMAAPDALNIVQRSMMAGARGFMLRPVDPAELVATIRQYYDLERSRAGLDGIGAGHPAKRGHIVAIAGLKGGVGRTMLATNLSLALQREITPVKQNLVLVDAHLEKGDCATHLNLRPSFSILDLLNRFNEVDHDLVNAALTPHESGIRLLSAPSMPNQVIQTPAYQVEQILTLLQDMFDYVILDLGPSLSEANLMILDMANTVLLAAMPEIPTLLHTKAMLDLSRERQYPRAKMQVILNRADMHGGIASNEIEEHLRIRLASRLPDDVGLVSHSINQGTPLVLSAERSEVARSIASLAAEFVSTADSGPNSGRKTSLLNVFDRLGTALRKDTVSESPSALQPRLTVAHGGVR